MAPIVIDSGSGIIKAGRCGQELPEVVFPSCVGRPKHRRVMASALEAEALMGSDVQKHRGVCSLKYPCQRGVIQDWDDMQRVWGQVFRDLRVQPDEQPILFTESPLVSSAQRKRTAEIMFETFRVPAVCFSMQAVLSLYAAGRTTGLVLDCGEGCTTAVPVYEGFAVTSAITRSDIGGSDVTDQLQLLLRRNGVALTTSAEREIVREMKEKVCEVDPRPRMDAAHLATAPNVTYRLPDGNVLTLGSERSRAAEVLFCPSIIGSEDSGVPDVIMRSVSKCDLEIRSTLLQSIVLSGGSTLLRGFGDRLLSELKKTAPHGTKLRITASPERQYTTWIGGSILASLSTFSTMWVTAQDYTADPHIIFKKFS